MKPPVMNGLFRYKQFLLVPTSVYDINLTMKTNTNEQFFENQPQRVSMNQIDSLEKDGKLKEHLPKLTHQ